ncbi:UbiH/UbiF family hydroxylase [Phreatobacter cathodiphilus]|uniref:2-octaprenyl-6-methoxyphenyl hydroxylase n=1 Tax=Phreatobacter cathodiphilus TaxID=1868589 RepID=A0A2S0N9Y5_9HYPH|nr:UbiH/UbiF family hydroxylase [Phreatobacter cathodiphilus]AVO44958.1 2-octaprenyl-6-methoxyphenyl hydroxylase [Phreatobacter cathodiphilus]
MSDIATRVRFDVVVVGAGPAGLFAGLALADAGFDVAVVGALPGQATDRRTSALLDGSVLALQRLGVWDRLRPHAAPLRVMRLVDATASLLRAPVFEGRSEEIGLDAFGFNLANDDIGEALLACARDRGVTLVEGHVTGVDIPGGTLTLASGEVLSATVVAGADGRRSQVREAAGIEVVATRYPQTAVTATFAHSRPHRDVSTEFHTPTGPFTLVPLPGDRSSLVCVVTPREADALLAMDDGAFAREIEKRSEAILGRVTPEPGRGRYDLGAMTPRRFAVPGAALVGEAAHVVPPIGAQGLNLGMRDGAALADCLSDARAAGEPLGGGRAMAAYDRARRADIVSRTFAIDVLNRSLLSPFLPVHLVRGAGLWALDQIGPLRRAFMREGLQPSQAAPRLMRPAARDAA